MGIDSDRPSVPLLETPFATDFRTLWALDPNPDPDPDCGFIKC